MRAVPMPLRDLIGCSTWRRKAGNTLTEAKRNALVFLEETDQLIREAQGQQVTPEQKLLSLLPARDQFPDDVDAHELIQMTSRESMYLDDIGTINPRYEQLHDLATGVLAGTARSPKTAAELLHIATLLKDPAASTKVEWTSHLAKVMEFSGKEFVTALTREDALAFRQHLLTNTAASTTKTRLKYLSGLFNVAVDEGWIDSNPFDGLTKNIRSKAVVKEVVRLDEADVNWSKLPQKEHLLWHILRWSGSHASEAAGLRWEDINLDQGTISFKSHETRPLKNTYRQRVIPIHPKLMEILSVALSTGAVDNSKGVAGDSTRSAGGAFTGLIFPWAYNEKAARWCESLHWSRVLGVSPKATRDWAASCLRSKDINERTIGKLFGHSPSKTSITGVYGSVDLDTMRRALDQLD